MNTFGLSLLMRMGCVCARESVQVGSRRYFVKERLGEGGFSYVDLIEDRHNHKYYALKRIACHSKEDERLSMVEVEIMKTFEQSNLCPCVESAISPINDPLRSLISEVLIVMPYYRKGTLQDEIEMMAKRLEHMREERILRLFRGICEGLKVMHSHNPPYAHRDIKPANVLIGDGDTPVIMDFGSAAKARVEIKGASEARRLQDIAAEKCTMPFRPPELFNVESYCVIDERVDIWSLGCTLYAMAFLESPFEQPFVRGDSVALAVMAGKIPLPDNTIYSTDLVSLIKSMLNVDIKHRPYLESVINQTENLINMAENRI
ncbi:serine/threonine-protein kinase 16-like [Lineus longissimus]|uniref:serine/threonine-protein kinase 16-like n=1 Tax=Lineus longissimus TaxID=88925 RepID=UPI002B4D63AD